MAQIPWWYDAPDAWDTCVLGGNTLPGLAKVTVSHGKKLDIKKPPGSHGATITDQGYKPAAVTITLRLWTPAQWDTLQKVIPSLEPPPKKGASTPFDILHPVAAMRAIKSVLLEELEGPDESAVRGVWEMKFKMIEFFPPLKANATNTPKTSIAPHDNALTRPVAPSPPSSVVPTP